MGRTRTGGDIYLVWRDDASAAGDETQRNLLLRAAARSSPDRVLEGPVPATLLERPGGELAEERTRPLPRSIADQAGVGVQRGGGEPRERLGADATASFGR